MAPGMSALVKTAAAIRADDQRIGALATALPLGLPYTVGASA
jgi:hypothetical protein